MRAASSKFIAVGFSQRTALPASSAARVISACVAGGVVTHTKSTSSRAITSRQLSPTNGISNSRATRSAFSLCPLATATTRAPPHALNAGICVVRANPAPMMPTPTTLSALM
jgi:hypothetical protein